MTVSFIGINFFLTWYFAVYRFNRFAVQHGPEVLTTVGIFGCFLGIAVALLKFDAGHVSTSVPELLEGVKTAFWASVRRAGCCCREYR
jgi:multisubunit Na+/H+ antiporter MnhG subunit